MEDWDRRLTTAYLQIIFQEGLLEGQQIFQKFDFRAPSSNINHTQVLFVERFTIFLSQEGLAEPPQIFGEKQAFFQVNTLN